MKASILKLHRTPKEGAWYRATEISGRFCVIAYDQGALLIEVQHETGEIEEWEMSYWLKLKPRVCYPPVTEAEEEEEVSSHEFATATALLDILIAEEEEERALIAQDIPRK
jgi:signal transduction histidine kinase